MDAKQRINEIFTYERHTVKGVVWHGIRTWAEMGLNYGIGIGLVILLFQAEMPSVAWVIIILLVAVAFLPQEQKI